MSIIPSQITKLAKKQENMTHNKEKKNQTIETKSEMTRDDRISRQELLINWLLLLGRQSSCTFPCSSCYVQFKILEIIYKTNIRKHWIGERKKNSEGPQDLNNNRMVSSLVFFWLMYLRLRSEEAGDPEMPTDTDKWGSNKSLLSLAKGPGKWQRNEKENF